MARGGRRVGTPGKAYSNRTDMHQPIQVAPGGEYGSATALKQGQQVVPLPTANVVAPPSSQVQAAPVAPGDINFEAPTQRPNEPVTNGLPVGAGQGPEALGIGVGPNDPATLLRSMYVNIPQAQNNDVLRLIEMFDKRAQ